jgi:molecular chaperone DnaJ
MKPNNKENYYTTLGLDKKCSKSDIDSAYRTLAIRWHPDKNKDNRETAEKRFREISKAYQILSDEQSRKNYDKHGVVDMSGSTDNLIDPFIFFKDVFKTENNDIPDVVVRLEATINELFVGFTRSVTFTRYSPCVKCNCTGTSNKQPDDCKKCTGRGILLETMEGGSMGYMMNEKKCSVCGGCGLNPDAKKCKKCDGNKYIKEDIECEVDVPAGAYDQYYIKLEDEGNYIPTNERKKNGNKSKSKERTDVMVVVGELVPDELQIRRGMFIREINRINKADLIMYVNVSQAEALTGIKKNLDYFGEKIGIDISEVVQNGDTVVIENMGMPYVPEELSDQRISTDKKRGDLFLIFRIEKPKLSVQQKKRLWQIITDTPYPVYEPMVNHQQTIGLDQYIEMHKNTKKNDRSSDDPDSDSDKSDYQPDNTSEQNDTSDGEKSLSEKSEQTDKNNQVKVINYK